MQKIICVFALLTLATALDSGSSCQPDDTSCAAEAASGSLLMQIDRSHKKESLQSIHHHAAREFSRLAHRVAPNGFCTHHPCQALLQTPPKGNSQLQSKGQVGKTATLSQSGYAEVAALKDDTEMNEFVRRLITEYDCKVTNDGGLSGIVPWFSGTTMVQSLAKLEDTLLSAVLTTPCWLSYKNSDRITGDKAVLSFMGYVQVAAMKSDTEMTKFVKRVCTDMGVKIVNEDGLTGMVTYYSGSDNFQSFGKLQSEIKSAANAPHSWAEWDKRYAQGYKYAQEMEPEPKGFSVLSSRASHGFCVGHPCRIPLLQLPSAPNSSNHSAPNRTIPHYPQQSLSQSSAAASPTSFHASKQVSGLGKRATLDQAGYAQVAALKDDEEMRDFAMRTVDKYDCKVKDIGGLMGIVPWFSGTSATQDLQKLEDTLLYAVLSRSKTPWLVYKNSERVTGDTAKLGFVGYVQVAAMRSDSEMQKYVKRICKDMGVNVVDDGGFQGMVKYYSGTENFQSYERLQSEIKSAANAPHSWANWIKKPTK